MDKDWGIITFLHWECSLFSSYAFLVPDFHTTSKNFIYWECWHSVKFRWNYPEVMNGKHLERQAFIFTRKDVEDLQRKQNCSHFISQSYLIEQVNRWYMCFPSQMILKIQLWKVSWGGKKSNGESCVVQERQVLIMCLYLDPLC